MVAPTVAHALLANGGPTAVLLLPSTPAEVARLALPVGLDNTEAAAPAPTLVPVLRVVRVPLANGGLLAGPPLPSTLAEVALPAPRAHLVSTALVAPALTRASVFPVPPALVEATGPPAVPRLPTTTLVSAQLVLPVAPTPVTVLAVVA